MRRSGLIRPEKRVKNMGQIRLTDPDASITYLYRHITVLCEGLYCDLSLGLCVIERILDEINEYAIDTIFIRKNMGNIRSQIEAHCQLFLFHYRMKTVCNI